MIARSEAGAQPPVGGTEGVVAGRSRPEWGQRGPCQQRPTSRAHPVRLERLRGSVVGPRLWNRDNLWTMIGTGVSRTPLALGLGLIAVGTAAAGARAEGCT